MRPISVPDGIWIPDKTLHIEIFENVYDKYTAHPEWWNPTVPDQNTYRLVVKYVDHYSYGDPVWEYIAKPGVQGVSLLYHEAEELRWLFGKKLQAFKRNDPYDDEYPKLLAEYEPAHSRGLIAEHRYLELLADHQFNLGELVKWNPVAEDPELDLRTLCSYLDNHGSHLVRRDELNVDEGRKSKVQAWYRTLNFQGLYR